MRGRSIGTFVDDVGLPDASGRVRVRADLDGLPGPLGPVDVLPGHTNDFTAWHRDFVTCVGATSDFADGLEVGFD